MIRVGVPALGMPAFNLPGTELDALTGFVRSLGAYFVRRNSGDPLYRAVLSRYVQMATESGVPQAVFPEGGLTRDGRLRELTSVQLLDVRAVLAVPLTVGDAAIGALVIGEQAGRRFDRIVSVEMFEHLHNYAELFRRLRRWSIS